MRYWMIAEQHDKTVAIQLLAKDIEEARAEIVRCLFSYAEPMPFDVTLVGALEKVDMGVLRGRLATHNRDKATPEKDE